MKRTIQFTSVYDGEEVVTTEVIDIPDNLPPHIDSYENEALRDFLWEFTGTGKPYAFDADEAGYFAESIDGLEPTISEEWV